jgi:hypothetical protein
MIAVIVALVVGFVVGLKKDVIVSKLKDVVSLVHKDGDKM